MSIDLEPSELQRSIAATIDDFCRDRCTPAVWARAGESFPLEQWTELANAAAGIVVGKLGTATCTRSELETFLS